MRLKFFLWNYLKNKLRVFIFRDNMIESSFSTSNQFLDIFEHLDQHKIGKYGKTTLNIFCLRINANDFEIQLLKKILRNAIVYYALSRKTIQEYESEKKWGDLFCDAKEKFINNNNKHGELGELLLYSFLETHLQAPKILSKLELKTSTNMYINGSDGIHLLKLDDKNYQLIFGESKVYKSLAEAISDAFTSISEFKTETNQKGNPKSGINYEKSLISNNILKEAYSSEDEKLLRGIIYPQKDRDFYVDDAFGIFIGFEETFKKLDKGKPNIQYREEAYQCIRQRVQNVLADIEKYILKHNLIMHNFYLYLVPLPNFDRLKEIEPWNS